MKLLVLISGAIFILSAPVKFGYATVSNEICNLWKENTVHQMNREYPGTTATRSRAYKVESVVEYVDSSLRTQYVDARLRIREEFDSKHSHDFLARIINDAVQDLFDFLREQRVSQFNLNFSALLTGNHREGLQPPLDDIFCFCAQSYQLIILQEHKAINFMRANENIGKIDGPSISQECLDPFPTDIYSKMQRGDRFTTLYMLIMGETAGKKLKEEAVKYLSSTNDETIRKQIRRVHDFIFSAIESFEHFDETVYIKLMSYLMEQFESHNYDSKKLHGLDHFAPLKEICRQQYNGYEYLANQGIKEIGTVFSTGAGTHSQLE